MRLFERPLVFVDIETTGGSYYSGRVLEVAAIRVENGRVTREYQTLLNPIGHVPPQITQLTGITTDDIVGAPLFEDIAEELSQVMDGAIFVAHNVRFDYSFLKREFARVGIDFTPRLLCSVRLSRSLFPQYARHSLQALIDRHGFSVAARHRAKDDAEIIWKFLKLCLAEFDLDTIEAAIAAQIKRQTLPPGLSEADIMRLPETPGVYIFDGDDAGIPLYVGKSINIRDRVLSHFRDDLKKASEFQISRQITGIRSIQTNGELGALLLESQLIKQLQPLYNKRLRKADVLSALSLKYVGDYSTAVITDDWTPESALALHRSKGRAKASLLALANDFKLCKKLLGLEKTSSACFGFQLGKCGGACIEAEDVTEYNQRFQRAFESSRIQSWPFNSAIMITERHPFVPGATAFVINNWTLVAKVDEDDDGNASVDELRMPFDLDAYKILSTYLKSPKARRTIREVEQSDVLAFASS